MNFFFIDAVKSASFFFNAPIFRSSVEEYKNSKINKKQKKNNWRKALVL